MGSKLEVGGDGAFISAIVSSTEVHKVLIRRAVNIDEKYWTVIFFIQDGFRVRVQSLECVGLGAFLAFLLSSFEVELGK